MTTTASFKKVNQGLLLFKCKCLQQNKIFKTKNILIWVTKLVNVSMSMMDIWFPLTNTYTQFTQGQFRTACSTDEISSH